MERGNARLRFIDEKFGRLLIRLISLCRRKHELPKKIRRIGLIKAAAIGDTILLSALISDLKAWDPSVEISLFTGTSNFAFAQHLRGVNHVILLPLKKPWLARRLMKSQNLDVCVDADSWPRITALLCVTSGAFSVGFQTTNQHRDGAFDLRVRHDGTIHELENYRNLLRALAIPVQCPPQNLAGRRDNSNELVFHLWPGGTRSSLREWPTQCWLTLATTLLSDSSRTLFLTGGAEDNNGNEMFIAALPERLRNRVHNCAGQGFEKVFDRLSRARLVVSVNTGLMHVAAAVGAPTIGLHGPTNPLRWGPIGPRVSAILSKTKGSGFLNLGFEYEGMPETMNGISLIDVLAEAQRLLVNSGHC